MYRRGQSIVVALGKCFGGCAAMLRPLLHAVGFADAHMDASVEQETHYAAIGEGYQRVYQYCCR